MSSSFTFTGRLRSVRYALVGVRTMLVSQHNAWVHVGGTVAVVVAGFVLRIDRAEWCCLIVAMMAVWTAEALNTAFEFLCDVASPEFHPMVAKSKDVAAGGVLMSAIGSVAIGVIVFGPRGKLSNETANIPDARPIHRAHGTNRREPKSCQDTAAAAAPRHAAAGVRTRPPEEAAAAHLRRPPRLGAPDARERHSRRYPKVSLP